ncbi:MAG: STAS domain-containing protein [Patescibacteria group bacterium]|jgi:anti-sigma B factor antagonist
MGRDSKLKDSVISENRDGIVIVGLIGQFNGVTLGPDLARVIDQALNQGSRKFLIDLAQTTYINSTGLGRLISEFGKVKVNGGQTVWCCAQKDTYKLLEITRLLNVLSYFDTEEQAVQALQDSQVAAK